MSDNTLAQIGRLLGVATEPLTTRLEGGHARRFFSMLGIDVPINVFTPELVNALASTSAAADVLGELVPELIAAVEAEKTTETVAKAIEIIEQVRSVVASIDTIVDEIKAISVPGFTPAELTAFMGDVAERAGELILVEHLQGFSPVVCSILRFFGVIEIERANVGEANLQLMEYDRKRFRFDRIEPLFSDPGALVGEIYGWGNSSLNARKLIDRLAELFAALGMTASRVELDGRPRLEIDFFSLTETSGVNPPGLDAELTLGLSKGLAIELPITAGLNAHISANADLEGSTGLSIRPPANLTVIPPSGQANGSVGMGFSVVPVLPATSITLLGMTGGTGLFLQRVSASIVTRFSWNGSQAEGDVGVEAMIEGGKLKINGEGADGFLAELLAGISMEADFDVGVSWTASDGLRFTGSHGLTIQLPSHVDLGPIALDAITLTLGIDDGKFPVTLATDIKAALGPLAVNIEQIGGTIVLSFPGQGGNAGPVQIDGRFKPPRGAGLALQAGPVSGGGYLYFDYDKGEYGGALELNLAGIVAVKAIGIIATKMPDGSDGFSLLIVITAEFGSGFQLGFGFTLIGVGGILGLNRGTALEPLAEGVRSGSLDNVMFPTNVIANAQRIIADLNAYFPIEVDVFVVGPLARIGWGTPTLISLSLGIVIEIPPGNIAILGVLKVVLPAEDAAFIVLQVNFIGALEFDKQRAWFFASMFGSRVLFMTIEGEMGVLIAWGDDANFVVSVGGFHPIYQPPPLPFPAPRRVAVSILNESWGRIRVEGYFSVTSNTVQFGATLDIFFGLSGFEISGYLSLDALFQFSPFYMIVDIAGRVSLKVAGLDLLTVKLKFTLEGPTPWRAKGSGSVKLLFFKVSASFDETWGDREDTSLPAIPVLPLLEAEFAKIGNWAASLPSSYSHSTTLRQLEETEKLVLHPLGSLTISQRAVPLGMDIDKIGNQAVNDANRFSVEADGGTFARLGETRDQFATGQYQNLTDDQKLSHKGFESQRSGLSLGAAGAGLRTVCAVTRTLRYELSIIDSSYRSRLRRLWGLASSLFQVLLGGSSVAKLPISNAAKKKINPFDDRIALRPGAYAVADVDTNVVTDVSHLQFASQAEAQAFINSGAAGTPRLHIVEAHEARLAV